MNKLGAVGSAADRLLVVASGAACKAGTGPFDSQHSSGFGSDSQATLSMRVPMHEETSFTETRRIRRVRAHTRWRDSVSCGWSNGGRIASTGHLNRKSDSLVYRTLLGGRLVGRVVGCRKSNSRVHTVRRFVQVFCLVAFVWVAFGTEIEFTELVSV